MYENEIKNLYLKFKFKIQNKNLKLYLKWLFYALFGQRLAEYVLFVKTITYILAQTYHPNPPPKRADVILERSHMSFSMLY